MNRRAYINFFRDSLVGSILISGTIFWLATVSGDEPAAKHRPSQSDLVGSWTLTADHLDKYGSQFSASKLVLKPDGTFTLSGLPGQLFDSSPGGRPRSGSGIWSLSAGDETWRVDFETNSSNWHEGFPADLLGDGPPYQLSLTAQDPDFGPSAILHRAGDIVPASRSARESADALLLIGGLLTVALACYQGFCFLITDSRAKSESPEMSIWEFTTSSGGGCALGTIVAPCSLLLMLLIGKSEDAGGILFWPPYAIFGGIVGVVSPAVGYMARYFVRWLGHLESRLRILR